MRTRTIMKQHVSSLGKAFCGLLLGFSLSAPLWAQTITLTSPANNRVFTAPAAITIQASTSITNIAKVEFYQGKTLIGSDSTSPYSITWNNAPAGSYSLTARAIPSVTSGSVVTSAPVSIVVNAPPTVSLTSPTGQGFATGSNIVLSASAADSDGTVSKVEFYRGTTLIGTDTTAPYSVTWSNAAAGSYSLTAKATDNRGASKTSTAVAITVAAAPTVALTAPTANQLFANGATIVLSANATPGNGNTLTKVEFYRGNTLIGTDTTAPYSVTWSNAPAGSYSLTAKATNNRNISSVSAAVRITVNAAPTVSITSPTPGQGFATGSNIVLNASATDSDGTVSKVEFYRGSTLIGSDTSAPYSVTWSNAAAGSYSLTAKATDNRGATTTSAPVTVTVGASSGAVYYLHTDHLNTPRLVTNEQNTVVWRNPALAEPFGTSPPEEDPDANGVPFTLNLRFPGQYFDRETNLSYNYFRDYDSTTGRYVQSDPIGLRGGINTYSYVEGNPVSRTDSLGLLGSHVKKYLCKLLEECQWDISCVFGRTNADRKEPDKVSGWNHWDNPTMRQAENFAYAAAYNDVGYFGVLGHQLQKTLGWPLGVSSHPSAEAGVAGLEGVSNQEKSPGQWKEWCNECQ
jgi:chitinase